MRERYYVCSFLEKFNVVVHVAAYLWDCRCGPEQSRQKYVGVHGSVVLRSVPGHFGVLYSQQGALTFLFPFGFIPNPCRRGKRERDDRDTGRPYGGSLESLCAVRRDSVQWTGPIARWDALNPFGSACLFVREIRTEIWIFHELFLLYTVLRDLLTWTEFEIQIIVNHGKSKERTGFLHTCICFTCKKLFHLRILN